LWRRFGRVAARCRRHAVRSEARSILPPSNGHGHNYQERRQPLLVGPVEAGRLRSRPPGPGPPGARGGVPRHRQGKIEASAERWSCALAPDPQKMLTVKKVVAAEFSGGCPPASATGFVGGAGWHPFKNSRPCSGLRCTHRILGPQVCRPPFFDTERGVVWSGDEIMIDPSSSLDRELKAADECFALSRTATSPFMRGVGERYLSSQGELRVPSERQDNAGSRKLTDR
jgi:hypothetical protein